MKSESADTFASHFILKTIGNFSNKTVSSDVLLEYVNECLFVDISMEILNKYILFLEESGYIRRVASRYNSSDLKWALTKEGKLISDEKLFGRGKYTDGGDVLNSSAKDELVNTELICPKCGENLRQGKIDEIL